MVVRKYLSEEKTNWMDVIFAVPPNHDGIFVIHGWNGCMKKQNSKCLEIRIVRFVPVDGIGFAHLWKQCASAMFVWRSCQWSPLWYRAAPFVGKVSTGPAAAVGTFQLVGSIGPTGCTLYSYHNCSMPCYCGMFAACPSQLQFFCSSSVDMPHMRIALQHIVLRHTCSWLKWLGCSTTLILVLEQCSGEPALLGPCAVLSAFNFEAPVECNEMQWACCSKFYLGRNG